MSVDKEALTEQGCCVWTDFPSMADVDEVSAAASVEPVWALAFSLARVSLQSDTLPKKGYMQKSPNAKK